MKNSKSMSMAQAMSSNYIRRIVELRDTMKELNDSCEQFVSQMERQLVDDDRDQLGYDMDRMKEKLDAAMRCLNNHP